MAKASIIPSPLIALFLFILLVVAATTTTPSYSNNQTDFQALLAFKKSILDGPMRALSSWNETTHFCSWNGVSCSKRHLDRVVSLCLPSQGLVGSLSPHIGNLSFLRIIDLKNNSFHGQIPEEMGRLTRLETIQLSNNSFQGGIPRNLSKCRNLSVMNLIDNNLTGSIVPEIGSLVNLEELGLSSNMLSGTIPAFLGNMSNLAWIRLEHCGLQGDIPASLAQLPRIRMLYLNGNSLTGSIPSSLYNHSSIERVKVRSNRLQGTLPSNIIFTLPMLTCLDLGENHFTGPLPASLSNSTKMKYLAIDSNDFTGEMIRAGKISTLLYLEASSNHLKGEIGPILSSLTNCTNLQILSLYDNLLTGSLPDSIGNLSRYLWYLSIGQNQLSGSIPPSIGNLIGLTFFIFEFNNLDGSIPLSIGKLPKLQSIYLRENRLTNEMPSSFGNLTLLTVLELSQNNLYGNIPTSLGNCTNLLILDLSQNNLNGSIPPEISRLSTISVLLNLSFNVLMGTIPLEVGSLRNLAALDLSHNRLSGLVPSTLSACVMLETLRLESNSLQGEIPDSLSYLKGLQDLDLSQNSFSGMIPRFLGDLRLLNLNLSFNALRGEVPTVGVFQNESAISLEGNRELCGGLASLNLPSCKSTNSKKKDFQKVWIPIVGAIFLLLSVCYFTITCSRRRSEKFQTAAISWVPEFLRLSYADLHNATGGFSEMNLLGAGKFGSVYRGTFDDDQNTLVAVKVLNLDVRGAIQSFAAECNALRGIRHRNLLKILSICDSIDFQGENLMALVYEFMPNGSLENWLHQNSDEEGRVLSTIQRLNIAIDIASAVDYLHYGTCSTIIHGDLKASNILLDKYMVAHVGDFGLSKIISRNMSSSKGSSSAAIKGTIGYIPPEYGMSNVVSIQGDAYSYGILLLELFTNKRPTSDDAFGVQLNLQDFVGSTLPDRVMEAVDPFLHDELNTNEEYQACIVSILSIGVRCSREAPRDRLTMAEVVHELSKIRNVFIACSHAYEEKVI